MIYLFYFVLIVFPYSSGVYEFELYSITFNIYTFLVPILMVVVVAAALMKRRFTIVRTDIFIGLVLLTFFQSTILSPDVVRSGFLYFHALLMSL